MAGRSPRSRGWCLSGPRGSGAKQGRARSAGGWVTPSAAPGAKEYHNSRVVVFVKSVCSRLRVFAQALRVFWMIHRFPLPFAGCVMA